MENERPRGWRRPVHGERRVPRGRAAAPAFVHLASLLAGQRDRDVGAVRPDRNEWSYDRPRDACGPDARGRASAQGLAANSWMAASIRGAMSGPSAHRHGANGLLVLVPRRALRQPQAQAWQKIHSI